MRLLRLLGLSLMAIFTIGVLVAASASANEPGFLSLAGGFKGLTFTAEGGEAILSTPARPKIVVCTSVKVEKGILGKAGDTHVNLGTGFLHFTGCKFNKVVACSSENEKKEKDLKEIILVDVDFHLIDVLTEANVLEPGIAVILLEPLNTIGTIKLNCGGNMVLVKGVPKGLILVTSLSEDVLTGEIHFFNAGEKCDTSDVLCKELDEKTFLADVGKGFEKGEEMALPKLTLSEMVLVDD